MTELERKLFEEFWRITHQNEKSSAPTEDNNTQLSTILPQVEIDENQLSLIYEGDGLHVQTL